MQKLLNLMMYHVRQLKAARYVLQIARESPWQQTALYTNKMTCKNNIYVHECIFQRAIVVYPHFEQCFQSGPERDLGLLILQEM